MTENIEAENNHEAFMDVDLNGLIFRRTQTIQDKLFFRESETFSMFHGGDVPQGVLDTGVTSDNRGEIKFGDEYQVRRLRSGDLGFIYAYNTHTQNGQFIINEFSDGNRWLSRTHITQDPQTRIITKVRESPPVVIPGRIDFSRQLEPHEVEPLLSIIEFPFSNLEITKRFIKPTGSEHDLINHQLAQYDRVDEAFRNNMQNIRDAERYAHQHLDGFIIGTDDSAIV